MQTEIIGSSGGNNGTFFEIVGKIGEGDTKYYPSIKNGVQLSYDHPEYWQHKKEVVRKTVRYAVVGNPICAEGWLKDIGYNAMACSPGTVDIYPEAGKDGVE